MHLKFHFAHLIVKSFKAAQQPSPVIEQEDKMGQPLWDGRKQEKEIGFYACDMIS